jgi:hypothetical protein
MDGVQGTTMRFAHIFSNGEVDQGGRGISQENVLVGEIVDPEVGPDKLRRQYCLVGLPPPLGGQVSGGLDPGDFDANDEHLWLTEDGACVVIDSPPDSPRFTGFHVLLRCTSAERFVLARSVPAPRPPAWVGNGAPDL